MKKTFVIVFVFLVIAIIPSIALSKTFDISIEDGAFNPSTLNISKGDTVRWTNNGTTLHRTTSGKAVGTSLPIGVPNGIFDSGYLNPGVSFAHTFESLGTIDYFDDFGRSVLRTGTLVVSEGGSVTISPASSLLHPFQSFDLVVFINAPFTTGPPKILVTFDGAVIFDGDWFQLLAITELSYSIPLEEAVASAKIHVNPQMLSPGVHTLTVKLTTSSGQEFSDTAVYTMARIIQGVL